MNIKFRKKPIVVEAIQFLESNIAQIVEKFTDILLVNNVMDHGFLKVITLERIMNVYPDDWIIKDFNGEYCSCKPDIFEKTYEKVEEENE